MLSREETGERFWKLPAYIVLPCVVSRLVILDQLVSMSV